MCSLASVFLLSTCITLIAAGHRPFQPRTPATTWDHFSKVLKAVPAAAPAPVHRSHSACSSSSSSPGGFDWNDHQEEADEEDAGAPAPAPAAAEDDDDECDVFDGEWVEDPVGYPLYDAAECPFLGDQVACHRNGRPDSGYERWRWQPSGCGGRTRVLGGAEALEACRDRRVVFVGDSLNRNMWESLACILYAAVPDRSRTRIVDVAGFKYRIFQATVYFLYY
nr:unnamed protein product [Digitaria exilis]